MSRKNHNSGIIIIGGMGRERNLDKVLELLANQVRSNDSLAPISPNLAVLEPYVSSEAECELAALRIKSLLARKFTPDDLKDLRVFTVDGHLLKRLKKWDPEAQKTLDGYLAGEPPLSGDELPSLFDKSDDGDHLKPKIGFYKGVPPTWQNAIKSVFPDDIITIFSFDSLAEAIPDSPPAVLIFDGLIDESLAQKIRSKRELDFIVLAASNVEGSDRGVADMVLTSKEPDPGELLKALFLSIERTLWRERLRARKTGMAIRAQVHKINQPLQVILSRLEIMAMENEIDSKLMKNLKNLTEKVMFTSEITVRIGRLARELTG